MTDMSVMFVHFFTTNYDGWVWCEPDQLMKTKVANSNWQLSEDMGATMVLVYSPL